MCNLTPPEGWVFNTADFSLLASGNYVVPGSVTFIREPKQRAKWSTLSEVYQTAFPLYVYGEGFTLTEAFEDACKKASTLASVFDADENTFGRIL